MGVVLVGLGKLSTFVGVNESEVIVAATEAFRKYLQRTRRRLTPEREAVLTAIFGAKGQLTADGLREALGSGPMIISRATVYNTLSLLTDSGLARRIQLDDMAPRYEAVRGRAKTASIHLVCRSCGKVRRIDDTEIERMVRAKRFDAFTTQLYEVNIYGTCSRCQRRLKSKK